MQATFLTTRMPTEESSRYRWQVMGSAVLLWNQENGNQCSSRSWFQTRTVVALSITARLNFGRLACVAVKNVTLKTWLSKTRLAEATETIQIGPTLTRNRKALAIAYERHLPPWTPKPYKPGYRFMSRCFWMLILILTLAITADPNS